MTYSTKFFEGQASGSARSAEVVVPLLLELLEPQSVVDIGCGTGTWLAVFKDTGIADIRGFDGDYVPRDELRIEASEFVAADLTQPLDAGRRFDLAVSLEVGEHLPESAAETYIKSLVKASPIVAFSAAIPLQGGTGHINEQWPTFWDERFEKEGYVAVDAIRPRIWEDDRVAWWYRQNLILFVDRDEIQRWPRLAAERETTMRRPLSVVHPLLLEKRNRKPIRPMPKLDVWKAWIRAGKAHLGPQK